MSYIGNSPITQAFLTDTFSGNGSNLVFTLTIAPATSTSIIVAVSGVLQDPSTYGVAGTTLTFSGAPPAGTNNISVRYLGIPSTGVTTTAYRTLNEFTATANQTSFTIPNYTVGYLDVYQNGVLLGTADYTANNGVNVVLNTGATAGDLITTESFYVSSVLDAVPATGGTFVGAVEFHGGIVNGANISGGAVVTGGLYSTGAYAGTYTDGIVLDYITGNARISAGSADNVSIYTDGLANVQIVSMSNVVTSFKNQTGGLIVPTGTTAQRPANATAGTIRWNTSNTTFEIYAGSSLGWTTIVNGNAYTASYLVVGGGGGGGEAGGGAGGLLSGTATLNGGTTYTITVGAGSAGVIASSGTPTVGASSSISGSIATALGGGGGAANAYYSGPSLNGGSGGGGYSPTAGAYLAGGYGTSGQGNNGGQGYKTGSSYYANGGGGGSSAVGSDGGGSGSSPVGGAGGAGTSSSITGSAVTYAGGGGGGSESGTAGSGGSGGGGNGKPANANGDAGTANTGGGGGGTHGGSYVGGNGGSGVVILSVPTAQYSGTTTGSPTVTTSGSNTIMKFTSSGSYTA